MSKYEVRFLDVYLDKKLEFSIESSSMYVAERDGKSQAVIDGHSESSLILLSVSRIL